MNEEAGTIFMVQSSVNTAFVAKDMKLSQ